MIYSTSVHVESAALHIFRVLTLTYGLLFSWVADASRAVPFVEELYYTDDGPVFGALSDSTHSFLSIPYVKAPVAELRWRDPERMTPWSKPRDVSPPPSICPQLNSKGDPDTFMGNEDCLYLSLHTRSPPNASATRPVLLFIHGGGMELGPYPLWNVFYLARDYGVVSIAFHYRLGVFGQLKLSSRMGADSWGIKDQRAAMQWTQRNVHAFGGDQRKVLIYGESAGGTSVCIHLVSPASNGLYSAAAVESGSCSTQVADAGTQEAFSSSFAAQVHGCTGSPKAVEKCMLSKSAKELVSKKMPPGALGNPYWFAAGFPWSPTVDCTSGGLKDVPLRLIEKGLFNRVPILLGVNTDEFFSGCKGNLSSCMFVNRLKRVVAPEGEEPKYEDEDIRQVFAKFVHLNFTDFEWSKVSEAYPISNFSSGKRRFAVMMADSFHWIGHCATGQMARYMVNAGHEDIWMYHFDVRDKYHLAQHADDLPYIFGTCEDCQRADSRDAKITKLFGEAFGRLARDGTPGQAWPRYTDGAGILRIGPTQGGQGVTSIEPSYREKFCELWRALDPRGAIGDVLILPRSARVRELGLH